MCNLCTKQIVIGFRIGKHSVKQRDVENSLSEFEIRNTVMARTNKQGAYYTGCGFLKIRCTFLGVPIISCRSPKRQLSEILTWA